MSAKDLGTGKEQHITITSGSNMSDSDIDKAVKEAAEYEAQDKKRKEAAKQPPKENGFIAVSIGEGIKEIFQGLGVDYLIEGGQTMNPAPRIC